MHQSLYAVTVLALCVVLCIVFVKYWAAKDSDVHRLPGPSPSIASWLWGHELLVFQHAAAQMHSIWARSFGGMYKIKGALFHPDIIIATDHAAVHHIFANSDLYVKSPVFRPLVMNILGKGVVWAEGEDWHQQRKILSPAFSLESVKEMVPAIYECAERLERNLTNLILDSSSKDGKTLNIVHYISACTLEIIGMVGLSHSFSAQSTESNPDSDAAQIHASWEDLVDMGLRPLAFLAPLIVRAIPALTWAPLPLPHSQGAVKRIVDRIGQKIIDRERGELKGKHANQEGAAPTSDSRDIISLLLRAKQPGNDAHGALTDTQILDNITTSIVAGHETTATTLTFTLWELARQPAIQDRLRAEVLSHGRDLSYDNIQKLEFLDAIVKEGLRLHPASSQTERVPLQDDLIPLSTPVDGIGATLRIKKGQVIHISFLSLNTSPHAWGPTASVFNPSRWLEESDLANRPHGWSGLLSFCDGPRNCIGWRLAVLEMKIILATLIRSIVFLDTGVVVEEKLSPGLQSIVGGKGRVLPLLLKAV
ncbi:cytochrome P450 [Mycena rosella]|uniref:Cytochrome P450 n=1 Tax=Mycena rosella TaxID=1033263 RepID=A0AAD7G4V8_MYCRO|nr:cytochrome P450 [Mycena rosella]